MFLKRLKLLNFKNYEDEQFFFKHYINCFYGLNGMGKTNVMDAIYYMCLGKSYHTAFDKNIKKLDTDFFRLEADFIHESKEHSYISKVVPGRLKEFEINGVKVKSLEEYIGQNPVVFITPDDIFTLLIGNEERRSFINNIIVQYDSQYLFHLSIYNKLLKQRNTLLKDFQLKKYFDEDLLSIITERMNPAAQYIFQIRHQMMKEFLPYVYNQYALISEEKETIDIEYNSQLFSNDFIELSRQNIDKDRITARTSVGIHRDEVNFFINRKPLKDFGSQGQIKSFILALKLAQSECLYLKSSQKPILLLDDIFDKLDPMRITRLLESIHSELFIQVFISDTHDNRVGNLLKTDEPYGSFKIEHGSIVTIEEKGV
jgi:DNA replication and repair protein RecF